MMVIFKDHNQVRIKINNNKCSYGDFKFNYQDNETLPVDQPASQPANQDNRGDSVLERTSGKQNTTSVANIVHEDNQSSEVRTGNK